jgi:uncharacterized membrane protein YphA (DoxX/SURF4 family)
MTMSTNNHQHRPINLAPLVLRLAVAGIFAVAGAGQLSRHHRPVETDAPPVPLVDQAVSEAMEAGQEAIVPAAEMVSDAVAAPAEVNDEGVRVSLGWNDLIGAGQLGFAAVLFLGLLTRLAALAGLGTVTLASLAHHEVFASGGWLDQLVGMYESNPVAMLLLGAICLSLLVSGSGPLALDRVFHRRRKSHSAAEAAPAA